MNLTSKRGGNHKAFKRAIVISVILHTAFFVMIVVSPSLPISSKKDIFHYVPVSLISIPGGGGGGGGGGIRQPETQEIGVTEVPKETLRDLTTLEKLQETQEPALTYPVEKLQKEKKPKTEKKAAINKPQPKTTTKTSAKKSSTQGTGTSPGSGLRIGVGEGPGGEGYGFGYGDPYGTSSFPFAYYLQMVRDKISANWFSSLVNPGVSGGIRTVIYFRIYRDGHCSDFKVQEDSGYRSFNLSALRAIQSATFPPLPSDYEGEYLGIYLIFEHTK